LHRGIQHGYALPERDVYDADATAADWMAIKGMLQAELLSNPAPLRDATSQ
jgi:hypothetical protein